MSAEVEEREFKIVATTTVTATFSVWAESEDEARDLVNEAQVTGRHAFDYRIDVPDATHVDADDWDVSTVEAR